MLICILKHRKLCQKLYFKAEAQEIDRILEVFSYKFWSQNSDKQLYQNAGTVIYSYSLCKIFS